MWLRRPLLFSGNSTLPDIRKLPATLTLTPAAPSSSVRLPGRGSNSSKEIVAQVSPANPPHPGPGLPAMKRIRVVVFECLADEIEVSGPAERAADDVAHQSEARTGDEFDPAGVVDLIGKRRRVEPGERAGHVAAGRRVADVDVLAETAAFVRTQPAEILPGCRRRRASSFSSPVGRRRSTAAARPPPAMRRK